MVQLRVLLSKPWFGMVKRVRVERPGSSDVCVRVWSLRFGDFFRFTVWGSGSMLGSEARVQGEVEEPKTVGGICSMAPSAVKRYQT